jgi:hypothetical protein
LNIWAAIGEADQAIEKYVDECSRNPDKVVYFLRKADKAKDDGIKCLRDSAQSRGLLIITCLHFKFFNHISRGAGSCDKGVQASGVC